MSVGKKRRTGTVRSKSNKVASQGICPLETCGKTRYLTRRDAKKVARNLFPGDHLTAYPCGDWWHFGHEPERVLHGYGWGSEDRLERRADWLRREAPEPVTVCEACSAEVWYVPNEGYVHDCEVKGEEESEEDPQ